MLDRHMQDEILQALQNAVSLVALSDVDTSLFTEFEKVASKVKENIKIKIKKAS